MTTFEYIINPSTGEKMYSASECKRQLLIKYNAIIVTASKIKATVTINDEDFVSELKEIQSISNIGLLEKHGKEILINRSIHKAYDKLIKEQ